MNISEKIESLIEAINSVLSRHEKRAQRRIKHQDTRQDRFSNQINRLRKQKIDSEEREKKVRQQKRAQTKRIQRRFL